MKWRSLTLLALVLLPTIAGAQDLLACISTDVKDAFFRFSPIGQSVVTNSVPAMLADLKLPKDFAFVGSKFDSAQTIVAYKTPQGLEDAIAAAADALLAAGWNSRLIEHDLPPFYCRDDEAVVVGGYGVDDRTFLQLTLGNEALNYLCTD